MNVGSNVLKEVVEVRTEAKRGVRDSEAMVTE